MAVFFTNPASRLSDAFLVRPALANFRHVIVRHHYDFLAIQTRSDRPAAIAGVTRSVLWILAKLECTA
jgi:hypothetical protein